MRIVAVLLVIAALLASGRADAVLPACVDAPGPFMTTMHRGAAELAPQNTPDAFRYAIAYDMPMIEVDVQQIADHRYVVLHDYQVDAKTDGSGYIQTMTYDQAIHLNAA